MEFWESSVIWTVNFVVFGFFIYLTSKFICRLWNILRRQFNARINCWFCARSSWVKYDDRNQFTCPYCEQYNGFKDDGDYNKEIWAQYTPKLNPRYQMAPTTTRTLPDDHFERSSIYSGSVSGSPPKNSLCDPCNRHQDMKVHQLAEFTPSDERNFDHEVAVFKAHLEDVYRLCPSCDRVVKRQLNHAKTLILGLKRSTGWQGKGVKGRRFSGRGLVDSLRHTLDRLFSAMVIVFVGQHFYPATLDAFLTAHIGPLVDWERIAAFWRAAHLLEVGHTLALGLAILQLLLTSRRGDDVVEYLRLGSLCLVHIFSAENLLLLQHQIPTDYRINSGAITWTLRTLALLASVADLIERIRWSPRRTAIKSHSSFHRIPVDRDEEEDNRSVFYDSLGSSRSFTGSTCDYTRSAGSSSSFRQRLNSSDPVRTGEFQQSSPSIASWSSANWSQPPRPSMPSSSKGPLVSESIRSLHIGGGDKRTPPSSFVNPFMKHVQPLLSPSPSLLSSRCYDGGSRQLLTPSRLSLACGMSTNVAAERSQSWLDGGFNSHQYPNVFACRTPSAFAATTTTSGLAMDTPLNGRSASRSSSESSGFESRRSTNSLESSAFRPTASFSPMPAWGWDKKSTFVRDGPLGMTSPGDTMGMGVFLQPDVLPRC